MLLRIMGTITYTYALGEKATLDFTGTGIEFIGSSKDYISDFKVTIDDEVVEERVESGTKGFASVVYSNTDLEPGDHSITIEAVKTVGEPGETEVLREQIDIDGFYIYKKVNPATDRKVLIEEYNKALKITDENKYTPESWAALKGAIGEALIVINNFDVVQDEIVQKKDELKYAREALEERKPKFTVSVVHGSGAGDYEEGTEVTVTADQADEGKQFKDWTVDGVEISDNTQNSLTFTMPANDVILTANYEMVPELSNEAGVAKVQVKDTKGVIVDNVINVVLPVGTSLTVNPDDIVITPKHEKAIVEGLKTDDQGTTWSFSVTAEDGITVKEYIINVSVAEDIKGQNEADVAAAKEFAVQNDWTISMDTANTQELVEAYVLAQLDDIIPDDVDTVLEMGEVIPASEGTVENPEGTDGTYSFTVSLAKGEDADKAEDYVEIKDAKIAAIKYIACPKVTVNTEGGENVIAGDKVILTATVEDITDPGYKWYKNTVGSTTGATVTGKNDNRLEVTAPIGTTYYYCEVNGIISNIVRIKAEEKVYKIVRDETDNSWQAGAKGGLTIKVDAPFEKYTGTEVDGLPVEEKYLTVESGSSTVTLNPEFLNSLESGKHTVAVLFEDGRAESEFAVTKSADTDKQEDPIKPGDPSKPEDTSKSGASSSGKATPKTGDQTNVILGFAVCGVCAIAIISVLIMKRRRSRK